MRRPEYRALWQAVAVAAVTLGAGALLDAHLAGLQVAAQRRAGTDLARGSAFAIEQEFARTLASASALAALVAEGGSEAEADGVASRLLPLLGETTTLQLAPDCVIRRSWPQRGNESALGLDLLHHPVHGSYTRRAIETRQPLLYGPFELVQGGAGLALRIPVFVRQGGVERPWGLASAIFRLQVLLAQSRLPRLVEAGYEYRILRPGQAGGPEEVLASSPAAPAILADPATVTVGLPGQAWTLAVAPRGGWRPSTSPLLVRLLVLCVSLLAGILAYRLLVLPEVLRREVAARTAELEEAHREQRRAEEAQRHSQKLEAIGLLAGGVAHDFNNLLSGIMGYADLLAAEAVPGTLAAEAAQTIAQAAQRGAQLTRQLLAFARMGSQRTVDVDVHAVAVEVTTLLARTLDKSIHVESRLAAPRHHVRGDPGQLQQVILNLAVNARDAMPEGGTITLESSVQEVGEEGVGRDLPAGEYLVLSVADTGVGIPPERLGRIFEPFYTTKEEGRGTGLGLATAYGIAKGHGGCVRVYSEVGVGSRFLVWLPLHPEPLAAAAEAATVAPRGTGVVLVVDDEELVRRSAARMLTSLGYTPALVAGGQEALDWLESREALPAAVVLDLSMPGMDGRACFRAMRARHPALPVIICSGFSRTGRVQDLLEEGAGAFVQKPYRTDELAAALAAARASPA